MAAQYFVTRRAAAKRRERGADERASNEIVMAAGFGRVFAAGQAVIIGATNLVFTLLALAVIDRVGRRVLLISARSV